MGEKKVKPPKLPADAPKELKDFLACKVMEVELDPAQAGWIPRPELVPEAMAPTVTPTATGDNSLSVNVGWGFVSITLPVSLSGGQLQVDATNMPGQQSVDEWVKSFNDALKSNKKELSGLELRNGKIHLTKRAIAAPVEATESATTPVVPPVTPAVTPPSVTPPPTTDAEPTEETAEANKLKPGCLIGILVALVLIIGVAVAFVVRDDSKSADSPTTTAGQASTTSAASIDEKLICANPELLQQVLADFGTDNPCEIDPDDFWDACDESFMPCFNGALPLVVLSPAVGVTHDGSVPDVVTGEPGPSQAEHLVQVVGPLADSTATIEVSSHCGNNTLTGQSPLVTTGVTAIRHPLLSFGACRADVYYRTANMRQLIGGYEYTVGDAIAAGPPATVGVTVPTDTTQNGAATTLGLLGGKALDPACTWFTATSALLNPGECLSDRWTFNAAYNDPRIASYGAGWVNPLGIPSPTGDQISFFGASRLFGPGTLFPCGSGHFGDTACPKDEATVATSAFVAGTVSWSTQLNDVPVGTYVEVGLDEYWVRLLRDANSWTLTSSEGGDSQARAILRGNAITFMIPYNEPAAPDLAYALKVGDDSGEIAQLPQPVLGVVTSTQGPETPADFFQRLSTSIATGDLAYALDRLHPLVLAAFPGDVCRIELSLRTAADYQIAVNSIGDTAPWTWELPDGRSLEVDDATTVTILLPGTTEPVESHIVNIDGLYYWFTICDGR